MFFQLAFDMNEIMGKKAPLAIIGWVLLLASCSVVTAPYTITKDAVKASIWTVTTTYKVTAGTTKIVYKIGKFTYSVTRAPLSWALTQDIQTIDGLPPKEAIRRGLAKDSPYKVKGRTYYPMTVAAARTYRQKGIASWYGWETRNQHGGRMTADGEVFDPRGLTAAHKYLPLPTYVRVTNLENGRALIVRVNDRGPFPSAHNPDSGNRIIDLSMGAAKRLGFYKQGTTRVLVESIREKPTRLAEAK